MPPTGFEPACKSACFSRWGITGVCTVGVLTNITQRLHGTQTSADHGVLGHRKSSRQGRRGRRHHAREAVRCACSSVCSRVAGMHVGLQSVGASRSGRPWFLFDGDDLAAWDVPASADVDQFTTFLALHADRYTDRAIIALGWRLRAAGLVWLCAWGPDCGRVHNLFDVVAIEEERTGIQRPWLMTDEINDEPLAEALWYALNAVGEDVKDLCKSAVVIGTDRGDWRREIRSWLGDEVELTRHVVEDLSADVKSRVPSPWTGPASGMSPDPGDPGRN